MWTGGCQALGPPSPTFPDALACSCIRSGAPGTRTDAHVQCCCWRQLLNLLHHRQLPSPWLLQVFTVNIFNIYLDRLFFFLFYIVLIFLVTFHFPKMNVLLYFGMLCYFMILLLLKKESFSLSVRSSQKLNTVVIISLQMMQISKTTEREREV